MRPATANRSSCPYCRHSHAPREHRFCPSPEAIRMACLQIQSTWDDHERQRRLGSAWDLDPVLREIAALSWETPESASAELADSGPW